MRQTKAARVRTYANIAVRPVDYMANGRGVIVEQASGAQNACVSNKWVLMRRL